MQRIIKKGKGWVKLTLNQKVYPLPTIYSAGYTFLERAYIYLDQNSKGRVTVQVFPKNKRENLDKLGMDFYNELLNYAHYFNRVKGNSEVIKMIMQRVLFSANPALAAEVREEEIGNLINELEKEDNRKEKALSGKKKR